MEERFASITVQTRQAIKHDAQVLAVAISEDGNTIVSGCSDSSCHFIRRDTANEGRFVTYRRRDHTRPIVEVDISGKVLAAASRDGSASICNVERTAMRKLKSGWAFSEARCCSLSANGKVVVALYVSAGGQQKVKVLALDDAFKPLEWRPPAEYARTPVVKSVVGDRPDYIYMAFSVTGSARFLVKKISMGTWKEVDSMTVEMRLKGDTPAISTDANMNSCVIATNSQLLVWTPEERQLELADYSNKVAPPCCSISSDGKIVVAGMDSNSFGVWDAEQGTMIAYLLGHSLPGTSCAVSGDGQKIVTGSLDSTVRTWRISDNDTSGSVNEPLIYVPDMHEGPCRQWFKVATSGVEGEPTNTLTVPETIREINALLLHCSRAQMSHSTIEDAFARVVEQRTVRVREEDFVRLFRAVREEQDSMNKRKEMLEVFAQWFRDSAKPATELSIRMAGWLVCALRDDLKTRNLLEDGKAPSDEEVDREISSFDADGNELIDEKEFIEAAKRLLFPVWD